MNQSRDPWQVAKENRELSIQAVAGLLAYKVLLKHKAGLDIKRLVTDEYEARKLDFSPCERKSRGRIIALAVNEVTENVATVKARHELETQIKAPVIEAPQPQIQQPVYRPVLVQPSARHARLRNIVALDDEREKIKVR